MGEIQNVSLLESLLPGDEDDPDADTELFGAKDAAEGASANQPKYMPL